MQLWKPGSWRTKKALQIPDYSDQEELKNVETELAKNPPLVFLSEIEQLKNELSYVSQGQAFLLQGGDCAESFAEFSTDNIRNMFEVMMQMALILTFETHLPIVKVGRVAGQFAKPRSQSYEERAGKKLPVYRGDIINSIEFSEDARKPDPQRMLAAYHQSASTLNLIRAFSKNGIASLDKAHHWSFSATKKTTETEMYKDIACKTINSLKFISACGVNYQNTGVLKETNYYTSHEALLLPYEEALTRRDLEKKVWYDGSAHLLWIGKRTQDLEGAHVEFVRGLANPVGVKIGANMKADELIRLANHLNSTNELGKLNLIVRMGREISDVLPPLIRAVQREGLSVIWSSDPMHANTIKAKNGYKTRKLSSILEELYDFFMIHRSEGSHPGGVHFEMTGQNVTECIGGQYHAAVTESTLGARYHTHCDPRVNPNQALEIAFMIAETLKACKAELDVGK